MEPNYVLKFNESYKQPIKEEKGKITLRKAFIFVWILIAINFLLGHNIFSSLNPLFSISFILMSIRAMRRPKEIVLMPTELHFYDDYFVIHKPKMVYSSTFAREENFKIKYEDINKFLYKSWSKNIHIYCSYDFICFKFDKSGIRQEQPYKNYFVKNSLLIVSIENGEDLDYVGILEKYSHVKFIVEESPGVNL